MSTALLRGSWMPSQRRARSSSRSSSSGSSGSSNGNGHVGADSRPASGSTGGRPSVPGMSRCASHASHACFVSCEWVLVQRPSPHNAFAPPCSMLRSILQLSSVRSVCPVGQNGARAVGTLVVRSSQPSPGARSRPAVKTALARAPASGVASRPRSQPPSPRSDSKQVARTA